MIYQGATERDDAIAILRYFRNVLATVIAVSVAWGLLCR